MDKFIKKIILNVTISAAFQRGSVYNSSLEKISDKCKKSLKETIKEELEKIGQNYTNTVSEEDHRRNIVGLSRDITKEHGEILENGQLRIGTAQKLLNVYIKFLWCLNPEQMAEPKHCPLDGIVLKEIGTNRGRCVL